jgi:hypothetical protein
VDASGEKVRENRLRRMAERQGLLLRKSRRRDPRALDYGTYMLIDLHTNALVSGERLTLGEAEAWLTSDEQRPRRRGRGAERRRG